MKPSPDEVTPVSLVADELAFLRKTFREVTKVYTERMEAEMDTAAAALEELSQVKKLTPAKVRDLRDMLTLIRMVDVKPEKGRRRDLKRVETVIEELLEFTKRW